MLQRGSEYAIIYYKEFMVKNNTFKRIDHLAIAVKDLEKAIVFYGDVLGLELVERRETRGSNSGMISAVFSAGNFDIVLMQGAEENSQVSRYVQAYGEGVQHVAFEVDDLEENTKKLKDAGMEFATSIINGGHIRQIFTKRESNCGMMIEFIERNGECGFEDGNVNDLFRQLEESDTF